MRILNRMGHEVYKKFVDELGDFPNSSPPKEILDDSELSVKLAINIEFPRFGEPTKYEFAAAMQKVIDKTLKTEVDHHCLPRIYDSLALKYFEIICPKKSTGEWAPHRREHYVFTDSYNLRHRHRIYGPLVFLRYGGNHMSGVFNSPPSVLGDFEEQIGSRQELGGNPVILSVLSKLYSRKDQKGIKRGFVSRVKYEGIEKKLASPGNLLRFVAVHLQLSRTYDLFGMTSEEILDLLPVEFDSWAK